jgi:fermentation-respiration switch protein FrsA (DUF1100 family)
MSGGNEKAPPARPRFGRVRRWVLLVALVYVAWVVALYSQQSRMIFPRQFSGPPMKEGRLPPGVQSIWINAGTETKPIRVEAWYLPAPGSSQDHKSPALIYCHGNAELIDDNMERAMQWSKRGFAVLIPEYRGYGRSGGEPSQSAITADMLRFFDTLVARPEVDASRIVVHGRSLGGGVAAQIAAARPVAEVILESTFTSVASFAWKYGAPSFICSDPFRTDEALRRFSRPVLIFHGTEDNIIPVSHGRALHSLIVSSTYVETPGDHINYPPDLKAFWGEIDKFIGSQR